MGPLTHRRYPSLSGGERTRVDAARAAAGEVPVMVFVGNPGCIQIHSGPMARPVESQGWLNVFGADFTLHLFRAGVGEAWLTRKPTRDGLVTSVEFFDEDGGDVAYIFGKRKPGIPELETWRGLCARLQSRFELGKCP